MSKMSVSSVIPVTMSELSYFILLTRLEKYEKIHPVKLNREKVRQDSIPAIRSLVATGRP